MKGTKFNRMFVLIGFMFLAGWLAFLQSQSDTLTPAHVLTVLTAVGAPVGIYIGVKGKGSAEVPSPTPEPERAPGE